jgi:hypothetical protein
MTRKFSTTQSTWLVAFATALCVGFMPTPVFAGKLDKVAKEIRSGSSSASNDNDYDYNFFDSDDDDYSESVVDIILFPWRLPYALIDDGRHGNLGFAAYPYAGDADGYLRTVDKRTSSFADRLAFRVCGDASYQLDGLWRGAIGARILLPLRLELDSEWRLYRENNRGEIPDSAVIGNAHLAYRFAQNAYLQFRTGVGYQQWIDDEGSEYGIDFTYGFDAFPGRPWIISVDAGMGSLGAAFVARVRATVGVNIDAVEFFAGYEHIDVNGIALSGPLLGARTWF